MLKKTLFYILFILFVYQCLLSTTISHTLTVDATTLTNIRASLDVTSGNEFLADSRDIISGFYGRGEEDPSRTFAVHSNLNIMISDHLQKGLFSTQSGTNSQDENLTQISDHLNSSSFGYTLADGPTELWNYFTTYNPIDGTTNCQQRMMNLCSLVNLASTLYDVMYYYYDSTYPNHDHPNLLKLKSIIETSTNLIDYTRAKYTLLSNSGAVARYYWGNPAYTPDFQENGRDVYLPRFRMIQDRILMCTAWGYGSLILRKNAQIQHIINPTDPANQAVIDQMNDNLNVINTMLNSTPIPNNFASDYTKQGLLAFHTGNTGQYIESLNYINCVLRMSNPFITTLARMSGDAHYVNYYDNPYIASWIEDAINKTTPYLGDWAYDDTFYFGYGTQKLTSFHVNTILNGVANFYYYNENNPGLRNKCTWYINSRKVDGRYPGLVQYDSYCKFLLLFLSNPATTPVNRQIPATINEPPLSYREGSWANSEFAILRGEINTASATTDLNTDLERKPAMYVVYQNSMNVDHNHADQTSYSYFYRGKQFFIDPGYANNFSGDWDYTRPWMRSPYAHNMVVINPLTQSEHFELNACYINYAGGHDYYLKGYGNDPEKSFRPTCRWEDSNPTSDSQMRKSPSYKTYFSKNGETDILKTFLRYDYNFGTEPFLVDLSRTFIRDGDLSFVYDDLTSSDNIPRTYWNLMQLGFNNNELSLKDSDNDSPGLYPDSATNATGIYSLMKGAITTYGNFKDCIDFSIGSTLTHTNYLDLVVNQTTTDDTYQFPTDNHVLERGGNDCSGGVNAGTTNNPHHKGINHGRIRSEVSDGLNPKFLTVIAPRSTYTDAQSIVQSIMTPDVQYGNAIARRSHTNSSNLCTTYCGVGNGSNISAVYTSNTVQTNGKFYLVTKPNSASSTSSVVDNSLVLMNGSYLNLNSIPVYHCYSSDINSMSASYLNQTLQVDLDAIRESYPRFKISRSGISPDHFSANLSFLIEAPDPNNPPDNDDLRSPRIDVIQQLAYDNDYFYVNYSIPDLTREGVTSSSLYIYSGNYEDVNVPDIIQFKGTNLTLSGDWTIDHDKQLIIAEGTTLKLTDDFNIVNEGDIYINGTETNQCYLIPNIAETVWGRIVTNPEGKLILRNCTIEYCSSIQVRGTIDSKNVDINHGNHSLMIISSSSYQIDNTDVSNSKGYALVMQNCTGVAARSFIKHSQFTFNKYGIFFYNSSPVLDSVFVTNNMHFGVMAMRNSNPVFRASSIADTYYHDTNVERPEVVLYNDCYPSLGKNDIIFDDGYSIFTYDTDPEPYICSDVYWGTLDTDLISQSFFPQPPSWDVTFIPILAESVINFTPVNTILSDYFDDAVGFEKSNDIETAKGMYCTIIENYPLSQQSKQAASRLVNVSTTDYEIGLVKSFMNNTYNLYPSTKLANAAYLDSLYCERLMKDYSQAIEGYESRLENCNGALDSLLTQLDIIYTFLEADANNTKSALVSCKINGVTLVSSEQAKEMESQIMDDIVNQPLQGDITYHIPDTVIYNSNYPNPFNPSTTISFSIPDKSACSLTIYNIKGQVVRTLVNEQKSRGKYNILWNGTDQHGTPVASGVYFYRLKINGKPYTHKMMMIK